MAKQKNQKQDAASEQPIPSGQKFFDNYFLWLILSFVISGVIYNAWGLVEIFTLPDLIP